MKTNLELEREITKLKDELAALKAGNLDARKRRIVNVLASQDPNDAVIRAELNQFRKDVAKPSDPVETSSEEVCVFGAYINTACLVKTNVCPPHLVKKAGSFKKLYATLSETFIEGTFVFRIRRNEEYLFESQPDETLFLTVTLPVDQDTFPVYTLERAELSESQLTNLALVEGDILTLDITEVGEAFAGLGLMIKLVY